jgi:alpha/beta superfamily hydrolase
MTATIARPAPERAGEALHEFAFAGAPERRLFTVFRAARGTARAALVLCPPFFHEQFLSYRLLSLVAARLAERGIASLRFDYYGSGDSWGDERAFTLDGACADAGTALAEVTRRVPGVPLVAFGARAGAWPAARLARQHRLPLWLWQPLTDGRAWLDELVAMDARERASRLRYPFIGTQPKAADPERLLASYCPPALRAQIAAERLDDLLGDGLSDLHVVDDERAAPIAHARQRLALPAAAAGWHEQIDLRATFITPPVAACIDALAQAAPGGATA